MHAYVEQEKKGNVDIVIYNLYSSPSPLLFTEFKPHHSEKVVRQRESTVTFLNARFLTTPYQVAGLPASSCYRHEYKRPTEKAAGASGKLLHPASWYRAFLCQRRTMAVTCWSPKAVPNPSPSCSSPQVSPTALEALVPVAMWHIQPGAPEVALTESWQATCDVTESGVTMASDLLMFIGNE